MQHTHVVECIGGNSGLAMCLSMTVAINANYKFLQSSTRKELRKCENATIFNPTMRECMLEVLLRRVDVISRFDKNGAPP